VSTWALLLAADMVVPALAGSAYQQSADAHYLRIPWAGLRFGPATAGRTRAYELWEQEGRPKGEGSNSFVAGRTGVAEINGLDSSRQLVFALAG
jgi:hypothetical protein